MTEWQASVQKFEIPEARTWVPIQMYLEKALCDEITPEPGHKIDIHRFSLRIPNTVASMVFRVAGHDAVSIFGDSDWEIENGPDPVYEGLDVFRVDVWAPAKGVVLDGKFEGCFVPA
jgi:hypothetical protein